ncbi:MAG: DUF5693 family protein [Bacillota bacterium]
MKKNRILIAVIIVGLIAASISIFSRITLESNDKKVDITLDYVEFQKLADQSGKGLGWWFQKMNEFGVSSVALNEESFQSMIEDYKPIRADIVGNILREGDWKETYPKELVAYFNENGIDEYDVVAITDSKELYQTIKTAMKERYQTKKFTVVEGATDYIFILDGTVDEAVYLKQPEKLDSTGKPTQQTPKLYSSKLLSIGLGFDPEKIELIKNSGMQVIPRPFNYSGWSSKKLVDAFIKDIENFNIQPAYMIFAGNEILGYPDAVQQTKRYLEDKDIKVGMIETGVQREHLEQEGLYELTRAMDYRAVRVFTLWPWIQKNYKAYNYEGAEEIENTLYRAVTERNIRMIFFKPFKHNDFKYVTDVKAYEKMFASFEERIERHGMSLGEASTLGFNRVRTLYRTLMGWGIIAGALLLLDCFLPIPRKFMYGLLGAGLLGVAGSLVVLQSLGDKILALGAAVVFPSLSIMYFCGRCKQYTFKENDKTSLINIIIGGAKELLLSSLISFSGAIFVAATLSHTEYLLEMDIFRGVKVSQLTPIFLYVLIYLVYFGYKHGKENSKELGLKWKDIHALIFEDIKVIYVLIGCVLGVVGYIYLARTGHETSVQPLQIELIGRNFLEMKLLARPRTKEFIGAFPALMVAVYFASRKIKWPVFICGLGAVIGQTSIVNTFSHLRTPFYLSVVRTLYSLGFGIVLGAIYILVIEVVLKVVRMVRGERLNG